MHTPWTRIVTLGLAVLASTCFLNAQEATVNHGVSLRSDPSIHNPAILTLQTGTKVILLEPSAKRGFYHVKASDGQEGWVGKNYLDITSGEATLLTTTPAGAGASSSGGAGQCVASLWDHVYNPQRLIVKQKCITVMGTIVDATNGKKPDGVRHEADGDTHGWLKLDAAFGNLLNAGNMSDEDGNMVFEIVCKFRVTQADAKPACQGYTSPIQVPPIGSHVRVVGTYVQDTHHARWMEIHPVTSITVIP